MLEISVAIDWHQNHKMQIFFLNKKIQYRLRSRGRERSFAVERHFRCIAIGLCMIDDWDLNAYSYKERKTLSKIEIKSHLSIKGNSNLRLKLRSNTNDRYRPKYSR